MSTKILRLPDVLHERARSRTAHFLDIKNGLFTHPVKIGMRATGWPYNEVMTLNAARIAGKTECEIRDLVIELESKRKNLVGGL